MKVIERLAGGLGGIVAGAVAIAVLRIFFDMSVRVLPVSGLIIDLLPGMVVGLILGVIFPKFFKWIFLFIPTSIS